MPNGFDAAQLTNKFDVCVCSYEAWVIYNFLSLCLAWVGGPGAVVVSLHGRVLEPSWHLMTCCCGPIPLDGSVFSLLL